jgi:hypothetical protein
LQKTIRKKFFKKYCFLEGSLVYYSKKASFSSKTKTSLWDSFDYASSISSGSQEFYRTPGPEISTGNEPTGWELNNSYINRLVPGLPFGERRHSEPWTKKCLTFNFLKNNFVLPLPHRGWGRTNFSKKFSSWAWAMPKEQQENTNQKNSLLSEFFPQRKKFMQYWIFPLVGFVGLTWNSKTNFPILNKFLVPETSQQVNNHKSVSFYFKNTNRVKTEPQLFRYAENSVVDLVPVVSKKETTETTELNQSVNFLNKNQEHTRKQKSNKDLGSDKILEIQKLNNFYLTFLQNKVFLNTKTEAFLNPSNNILWFNSQNFHQVFNLNFLEWGNECTSPLGNSPVQKFDGSGSMQISGQANLGNSLNQKNFQFSQIFENCPKKILPTFMKTDFLTINLSYTKQSLGIHKKLDLKSANKVQLVAGENFAKEIQKLQPVYFYYKAKLLLETNFKNSFFKSSRLQLPHNNVNLQTKDWFWFSKLNHKLSNKTEAEKSRNEKLLKKLKNQEKFFFKNVKGSKILSNFSSIYLVNKGRPVGEEHGHGRTSPEPRTKSYLSSGLSPFPQKFGQKNSWKRHNFVEKSTLLMGSGQNLLLEPQLNLKFIAKKFHFDLNFFLFFKAKNSKLFPVVQKDLQDLGWAFSPVPPKGSNSPNQKFHGQILKNQITEKQKSHKIKKLEQLVFTPTLDKFSEVGLQSKNSDTNSKKKFLFYLLKITNFSKKINQLNKFLLTPSFQNRKDAQTRIKKTPIQNSSTLTNQSKTKFKNFTYKLYLLNTISNKMMLLASGFKDPIQLREEASLTSNYPLQGGNMIKGSKAMESNSSLLLNNQNMTISKIVHSRNSKNQTTKLTTFLRSGTFFKNQTFSSISLVRGTFGSGPVVQKELQENPSGLLPQKQSTQKLDLSSITEMNGSSLAWLDFAEDKAQNEFLFFLEKLLNEFLNLWSNMKSSLFLSSSSASASFGELHAFHFSQSLEEREQEQKFICPWNLGLANASPEFLTWSSVRTPGTNNSKNSIGLSKKKKFLIPKILDKKNQSSIFKKEKIFRTLLSSKSILKDGTIPFSNRLKLLATVKQEKFGSSTSKKFSKLSNEQKKDFFVKTLKQLKSMNSSFEAKEYIEETKGEEVTNKNFTQSIQLGNLKEIYKRKPFFSSSERTTGPGLLLPFGGTGEKAQPKLKVPRTFRSNSKKVQSHKFSLNQTIQKVGFVFYGQKEVSGLLKEVEKRDLDFFKKEKYFQKKRRRKKLKLENRRRKKRKRFYPRPVWLRYNVYRQFLNLRYNKSFQKKKLNFLMKFKKNSQVFGSSSSSSSQLSSKYDMCVGRSMKGMKYNFLFKKFSSLKSIYRTNKQKWGNFLLDTTFLEKNLIKKFVLANHLPIYLNKNNSQITNQILNDFMPLYWKSYWLRTNLTPYMNRIKKNLNFQKSLAFHQESTEFSYNQTFLSNLLGFFSPGSGAVGMKTELSYSPISFYSNKKPSFEKFSDFSVSNSELIERMRLIREHDRILFERISEIVKNVKYNMNLDGENSIKSYKLPKGKYNGLINAVSQGGQRNLKETNSLANTLKSSMFQQLDPNFSLFSAFNGASVSSNGTLLKPYGSNATLRVLWAFNKTNLFSFKEKNSIRNLWETYKNREQSKSNQTKKFFKKTFTNISKNGWSTSKVWPDSANELRMLNLIEKQIPDFLKQTSSLKATTGLGTISQTKNLKKKNYLNKFMLEKMLRSAETHQKKLYYSANVSSSSKGTQGLEQFKLVPGHTPKTKKKLFYVNFKDSFIHKASFSPNFTASNDKSYFKRVFMESIGSGSSFINEKKADSFNKPLLKKSSVFFWWSNKNFMDWPTFKGANFIPAENSFFLKFIWSFSILFHLCILINFLKLPELRNLLKFQLSLIYKISNIYFIPLFYFYNSVQLTGRKFFFFCFPNLGTGSETKLWFTKPAYGQPDQMLDQTKVTNKIKPVLFNLYNKNFYSKQIQKRTENDYFNRLNKSIFQSLRKEKNMVSSTSLVEKRPTDFNKFVFNNVKIYKFILLSDTLSKTNSSQLSNSFVNSTISKGIPLLKRVSLAAKARQPRLPIQGYYRRRMLGTKLSLLVSKISKIFVVLGLNSVQLIYNILLQGISFVESILVLIYKFLEKPAELMVESIAQIFLIEWISDISTFLPETLDKNLWQSFQKLSRPTRMMGLFLGGPSLNYLLPFISKKEQLSFEQNGGLLPSLTSFPFSFLFLNTFKFYSMEIWQFLLKPDMDIYSRQKRGIYFMNIWGEIFVQAAEKYQMNATSLATNNLEQEKFLERLLKDPEIFSSIYKVNTGWALGSAHAQELIHTGLIPRTSKRNTRFFSNETAKSNQLSAIKTNRFFEDLLSSTKEGTKQNHQFSEKEQLFVRLRKAIQRGENSFASFPVNQHIIASCFGALAYATTERDLFLDISPPKSFRLSNQNGLVSRTTAGYLHSPVSFILGPLVCEVYSGLFSKKVSKNILLIPSSSYVRGTLGSEPRVSKIPQTSLNETSASFIRLKNSKISTGTSNSINRTTLGNALIQALAGETEMKLIIDNAKRYAANFHNKAIGIRLLKDVFMSIALQTPSFFLMEDIHFIGEKRPMLIGNFADENPGSEIINFEQDEVYFQNLFNSRQKTLSYKRFSNTDSSSIPSNFFTKHFFAYKNNKVYKTFGSLNKEFSNSHQFQNTRTNSRKQKRHPFQLSQPLISSLQSSKPLEQTFGSPEKSLKNSFVSRLQKQSEEFFAPPSTSPFTILLMKDQNKLKGTKSNFIPWTIFKNQKNNSQEGDKSTSILSNKTIRSKIAELADITLRNFSVSIDMITDLLVIVDSVRSNRGFVVFATTPIPSVLDPALRRPGRFDETLCLPEFSILNDSVNPESQIYKIYKKSISQYIFPVVQKNYRFDFGHSPGTHSFLKFLGGCTSPKGNSPGQNQFYVQDWVGDGQVRPSAKGSPYPSSAQTPVLPLPPLWGSRGWGSRKKFNELTVRKKLTKIFFLTSSLISDFLIQTDLLKNQTTKYFNQTFQYNKNSDQLTVLFLLFSSTSQYKDLIPLFLAPKVVDFFYSVRLGQKNSPEFKKLSSLCFFNSSFPLGSAGLNKFETQRIFYSLTDSSSSTDFIFSILQKRYLFQKNFIVSKLLMENTSYGLKEPPGPPVSEILMPAKKYEAFKATEKDFIFKNSFSIYEKMHTHQKQRFLKKLYNQPVQIYFKSHTKFNDFTTFVNSFKELGSIYSKSSGSSANSTQILRNMSSTNYYYKTRFLMRHRFSITNQWSNAQLPEHNAESTFLSDVDWRSMYVPVVQKNNRSGNLEVFPVGEGQSLQENKLLDTNKKFVHSVENVHTQKDFKIDFPDAEQYYNPRIRKWILRSSIHSVVNPLASKQLQVGTQTSHFMEPNQSSLSENIFTYEIYYHFLMQAFYKTYNYFDKNRELLDYFIFKYLLKGSLLELNSIFMLTRFYKK